MQSGNWQPAGFPLEPESASQRDVISKWRSEKLLHTPELQELCITGFYLGKNFWLKLVVSHYSKYADSKCSKSKGLPGLIKSLQNEAKNMNAEACLLSV